MPSSSVLDGREVLGLERDAVEQGDEAPRRRLRGERDPHRAAARCSETRGGRRVSRETDGAGLGTPTSRSLLGRLDDDPAAGLVALAAGDHLGPVLQRHVHDAPVVRASSGRARSPRRARPPPARPGRPGPRGRRRAAPGSRRRRATRGGATRPRRGSRSGEAGTAARRWSRRRGRSSAGGAVALDASPRRSLSSSPAPRPRAPRGPCPRTTASSARARASRARAGPAAVRRRRARSLPVIVFFLERVPLAGRAGREGPFGARAAARASRVADASTGARRLGRLLRLRRLVGLGGVLSLGRVQSLRGLLRLGGVERLGGRGGLLLLGRDLGNPGLRLGRLLRPAVAARLRRGVARPPAPPLARGRRGRGGGLLRDGRLLLLLRRAVVRCAVRQGGRARGLGLRRGARALLGRRRRTSPRDRRGAGRCDVRITSCWPRSRGWSSSSR